MLIKELLAISEDSKNKDKSPMEKLKDAAADLDIAKKELKKNPFKKVKLGEAAKAGDVVWHFVLNRKDYHFSSEEKAIKFLKATAKTVIEKELNNSKTKKFADGEDFLVALRKELNKIDKISTIKGMLNFFDSVNHDFGVTGLELDDIQDSKGNYKVLVKRVIHEDLSSNAAKRLVANFVDEIEDLHKRVKSSLESERGGLKAIDDEAFDLLSKAEDSLEKAFETSFKAFRSMK